jgi:acetoin utilization deacetylase AcuC-like enzyme
MSLILISSERFADHQTPPGHPESPERADVMDVVAAEWRRSGGEVVPPRPATQEHLARVHDPEYLRRVHETAGTAVALDPDTFTSPDTCDVALLAAGAAVGAVEHVMADGARQRVVASAAGDGPRRALALVRPPGHHAERNRAMGFCLYNNVAVAAAHARALGAPRVAIVDFDVHHGNGTQHMFEADPSVLYVSTHQFPFYPGTGAAGEIGRGEGEGFTVNLPLEVGAQDQDYQAAFSEVIRPVLRQFNPELLLVSAGFDAHERDPLAGMRLTTDAFRAMTMELCALAEECCGGRMVVVTEGGYDLRALAESLRTVIAVLAANRTDSIDWPARGTLAARGRAAVEAATRSLGRFWSLSHSAGSVK